MFGYWGTTSTHTAGKTAIVAQNVNIVVIAIGQDAEKASFRSDLYSMGLMGNDVDLFISGASLVK